MFANRSRLLSCLVVGLIGWSGAESAAQDGCPDSDGDGVCDAFDDCPNTIPDVHIDDAGCPPIAPGDFDGDGDVDNTDFWVMRRCLRGPYRQFEPPMGDADVCLDADFDFDADVVDLRDFAAFVLCFSGEDMPSNPGCMTMTATIVGGCLQVVGTGASSSLALRLSPLLPGILHVDDGADGSSDFSFDRNLFDCISVFARGGNDVVLIDESSGSFTNTEVTTILGGSGRDHLLGGSSRERLVGESGDDTLEGNQGNDDVFGGGGDDRLIWDPGDDTDLMEGGDGLDTVEVNGGNGAEVFLVTANGTRVRLERYISAPFTLDIGTCENLVLNANGGDDSFSATGNLVALIQLTVDGGAGKDTLWGGNGADLLLGGDDDDFIDGGQGSDVVLMGAGDDVFQWDPGDGNDTVEGQIGFDEVFISGSNASEMFGFSANGSRLRFYRSVASVVMYCDGVERVDLRTLGDVDFVLVDTLAGTDVVEVNLDFAGVMGGTGGDGQVDGVTVTGTTGDDVVTISGAAGTVSVTGLAASIAISHAESSLDRLAVDVLAGDDAVDASGLGANGIDLALDGGDGGDTLIGGDGSDVIVGGNGDDVLIGGPGLDFLDGGTGDNIVIP